MTHLKRRIEQGHDEYPVRLRELANDAPAAVYACGRIPERRAAAIVGTRRADAAGLAFTERLAHELARAGVAIVSGGAHGIDAAAHRGALEGGAPTIVVHGTSLEATHPRAHTRLFADILDHGGAWIGETPPGAPAEGWRFIRRNRIIAALADLVIVVQAPARSGALATAAFARALRRPLFAVPAAPWDPRGEGALGLLAEGARVCRSSGDVLALLGLPGVPIDAPRRVPESADAARVLEALADATSVDELVRTTELGAARVQVALVHLAIAGLARQDAGMWRAT